MRSILVDSVSKCFRLNTSRSDWTGRGLGRILRRNQRELFWALKNIGFEVEQGQALGIIGHNGAGKSTLLKLLTHIMEPTTGRIHTRGRVSALIEIGAGFHPEMTGRENIYLNASILGMTAPEIKSKLDEIIAFAEIEKFIDTPVKRYSSGMYARLGFAVAAHVDPEIMLVDEVLSVGDERFQAKCQEHMSKQMRGGATVLFVSHNLPAVMALCPECLVIDHGECVFRGDSVEGVRLMRRLQHAVGQDEDGTVDDPQHPVKITRVSLLDESGREVDEVSPGSPLTVEIRGCSAVSLPGLNFGIEIARADGVMAFDINSRMDSYLPSVSKGSFVVRLNIPRCDLVEGIYSISAGIMDIHEHIHYSTRHRCAYFTVIDSIPYRGIARLDHQWEFQEEAGK